MCGQRNSQGPEIPGCWPSGGSMNPPTNLDREDEDFSIRAQISPLGVVLSWVEKCQQVLSL